jgi:glycerophosphoryl diester phosphodiesterase
MMKTPFLLFLTLVSATTTQAQPQQLDALVKQFRNPTANVVLVAAHRGDWRNAPENSINALDRCLKMGVDIMETDVQKTKDGFLVLMHDKTLNRTTTGTGKISDWTLDSLKTLKLKQGQGIAVNERIPTLEEAMLFAKGKPILIQLDKSWDYFPECYAVLKKTGTVRQAIFKGKETLDQLRQKHGTLMDSIQYMPMVWPMDYNIYGETAAHPARFVNGFLTTDFKPIGFEVIINKEDSPVLLEAVPAIQKSGITVWINTLWDELCASHADEAAILNPDANWGWVLARGANVIQTDRPKELLDYLRMKKLHE